MDTTSTYKKPFKEKRLKLVMDVIEEKKTGNPDRPLIFILLPPYFEYHMISPNSNYMVYYSTQYSQF